MGVKLKGKQNKSGVTVMRNKAFIQFLTFILVLWVGVLFAKEPETLRDMLKKLNLFKPAQPTYVQTTANAGNWAYYVRRDGCSACYFILSNGGGVYPRGTSNIIFTDGLIWGGIVMNPDATEPDTSLDYLKTPVRVGGQTYVIGTVPGWIETPGQVNGNQYTPPVAVSSDNERARIYRIRRDWENLKINDPEVRRDAAEIELVTLDAVTDEMAQAVIDQYALDWAEWPGDLGAPFYDNNGNGQWDPGVDEPGLAGADQVIWFVMNDTDPGATGALYGSPPIGLEIQVTIWSYNQPNTELGQIVYKRVRFINKSGLKIDSMFVAQWSDPDVGNYTDDLAGCDVERSLGFAYSGFIRDDSYDDFGLPPGAVGYDFFQGPLVPGAAEDTAIWDLKKRPGYRNLPMTSFGYFAAGSPISDPPLGDYVGTVDWYKMLNGYIPTHDDNFANLTPYVHGFGDKAGQPTKFPLDGDPFRLTGDIDGYGTNIQPSDRRIFLCSGPFTMMPGDTQEITLAVVGGIVAKEGGTNRNAVEQMKLNDDFAQFIYDNLFVGIPSPPPPPKVRVVTQEDRIVLEWGSDFEAVKATENTVILGFKFEGYNVYQLPTEKATKAQAKKIATFDLNNNFTTIIGKEFVPEFGEILEVPIQKGTNTGIQRFFLVEKDYINDKPLNAGSPYYFAVTAYNVADANNDGVVDKNIPVPSLESSLSPILVVPQPPKPGVLLGGDAGSDVPVEHVQGNSDGEVKVVILDPQQLSGDSYQVYFQKDTTTGEVMWNLKNLTKNQVVFAKNQPQVPDVINYTDQPIFNGIQVRVAGPPLAIKDWSWTSGEPSPLYPDYDRGRWITGGHGGSALYGGLFIFDNFWGEPGLVPPSQLVPVKIEFTYMTGYDDWNGNGEYDIGEPYYFDTTKGQKAYMYQSWGGGKYLGYFDVPFKVYDMSDPDNPRQLNVVVRDRNENHQWDLHTDVYEMIRTPAFGGDTIEIDTRYNYVFIMASDYDPDGKTYDPNQGGIDFMAEIVKSPPQVDCYYAMWVNQRGTRPMLAESATLEWVPYLVNSEEDIFEFTLPLTTYTVEQEKADVDKINVFPNPYYASNPIEPNRFTHFVTFNHLPRRAVFRIFNLAGDLVWRGEKNDDSQFFRWELKNDSGLPVASGIYIVHIEMPDLGKTKVLKLFVVQPEQILEFY